MKEQEFQKKKMHQWFSTTEVDISQPIFEKLSSLEIPEIFEISYSSPLTSDSVISSVLLLFFNLLMPTMRQVFRTTFTQIPFAAINTKKTLSNYIDKILESGSTSIRKVRLFTTGHQGAGKTSLIHSVRSEIKMKFLFSFLLILSILEELRIFCQKRTVDYWKQNWWISWKIFNLKAEIT